MGELRADEVIDGIPSGTVAFLFTDVEGSTRLWETHPDEMRDALERHDRLVRASIETNGGYVFSLAGDQFVAAFHHVRDAVTAARSAQTTLAAETWPAETPIRIRIGIHVGVAEERDNDYFGQVLNRTARVVAAGHGGQTLLSSAAAALADGIEMTDLGDHRLKDLAEPEHLWQLGTARFAPPRALRSGHHNLPVERTPLIGRSDDVAAIAETVRDHRLVSLLGIGGTGKTRLALAVAAEVADHFEDGTWFVDLVPTTDTNSIAEAAAAASGLRLTSHDLLDALADQAAQRKLLFVFDNCEHVTDDAADVIDLLLERSADVHIIVTSREPLDLPDEHQVRVAPLAVDETAASPAVRLFVDAAARVGADLTDDDTALASSVCEHLDGLPLSIELAAAQLRQLTLTELAERMDQRFELLARGRSNRRRRRQASLVNVLTDSWELLVETEQRLLMHLAAFPSSFTLDDVEEITGNAAGLSHTLGALADRGLVASDGAGASRLLETVKLFVRQRWDDDTEDFAEAHVSWVLTHLRDHGADNSHQSIPLAGWAVRHYDSHRAVEDRLAAAGRLDELTELLRALRWVYSRETPERAASVIERIERYLDRFDLTARQTASLHLVAGRAGRAARNGEWIRRGGETAVDLLRADGPTAELATALIVATFHAINHDPPATYAMLDDAHAIADELGAETLAAATLGYRVNYLAMQLRFDEARELLAELAARPGADRVDNILVMRLEATLMVNMLADPHAARAAIERCVDVMSSHGLDHDWFLLLHRASGTAATGDIAATHACVGEAVTRLDQSGMDGLPDILLPYAVLAHAVGEHDRCRRWLTTVRNAPAPLGTGITIATYRIHRDAVGLDASDPLETATIEQIHAEAHAWLNDLTGSRLSATPG